VVPRHPGQMEEIRGDRLEVFRARGSRAAKAAAVIDRRWL